MTFRIGQKICCIDDAPNPAKHPDIYRLIQMPVNGNVYTIRGFDGPNSIWLEEIVNPPMRWRTGIHECSFWAVRFRPVVDIGWAHAIDRQVFSKQPARAL